MTEDFQWDRRVYLKKNTYWLATFRVDEILKGTFCCKYLKDGSKLSCCGDKF